MFVLQSNISIGKYSFTSVHELSISKSIYIIADTAFIILPSSAHLQYNKNADAPSVSINSLAAIIQEGDAVSIQLGYNNEFKTEFSGYVKKVHLSTPLCVECEGFSWLMRNHNSLFTFSFAQCSLKELLTLITKQYPQISLSADIQDISFGPIAVAGLTGAAVLELLRKWGFYVYFVNGNILYAGLLPYNGDTAIVKYSLGWNTISEEELIYRDADETQIQIALTYKDEAGKTQHEVYGTSGTAVITKKYHLPFLADEATRTNFVNAYARRHCYVGYSGSINTFLQPFAQPAYAAQINDNNFPDRNGTFIIESVYTSYGSRGARRKIDIGRSIAPQEPLALKI